MGGKIQRELKLLMASWHQFITKFLKPTKIISAQLESNVPFIPEIKKKIKDKEKVVRQRIHFLSDSDSE